MEKNELEKRFVKYLTLKNKKDGSTYGANYIKDKLARLRKLEQLFELEKLENITEKNYFDFANDVMSLFKQPIGVSNRHYRYADYLVIIRLLYEMNNKGKKAPRYAFYGGIKVG